MLAQEYLPRNLPLSAQCARAKGKLGSTFSPLLTSTSHLPYNPYNTIQHTISHALPSHALPSSRSISACWISARGRRHEGFAGGIEASHASRAS